MPIIAKVVVDISIDREFDYSIPESMADRLTMGSRVKVSFGRRTTHGYVVGFSDSSSRKNIKDITSIESSGSFINEKMLKLSRWMAEYYCSTIEQAIRAVLPGVVRRDGARFKEQMFVSLISRPDIGLNNEKFSRKQAEVMSLLQSKGGIFLNDLKQELGVTAAPVIALQKKGYVSVLPERKRRDPLANRNVLPTEPLKLTHEQESALVLIKQSIDAVHETGRIGDGVAPAVPSNVVLLHGVTGSGKTEVYLQAISYVMEKGMGAIVLVPEIALTPQTVERFMGRFGSGVAVLHSHLSEGERHDEWHRIQEGRVGIVIGARSAVFAPVKKLGLIVVDEEHEPSYKQEDSLRYNARDVAVMRGKIENCAVVLGSATPALESWVNTQKGKYQLAQLRDRVDKRKMPLMRIIDMRVEAERTGTVSVFSRDLLEAIRIRLNRGEQSILFLNRRGYASSLTCPKCGFVAACGECSVSYTYHREDHKLRCHICGGVMNVPAKCPGCGDPAFKFLGMGTQRIEKIIGKCFPKAKIQRMDTDVTTRKDSYERILGDFKVGKIDILIGTQMIAKGLHFPNVTLVGVIYADLSLHMPDFRSGERTFQLLAQVAGRAGRGDAPGEVIIQTYTPFNPAIQAVRRVDYSGFCDQELAFRRDLKYPPFSHLVCITMKGVSQEKTRFYCGALSRELKKAKVTGVIISDVVPAPLSRAKGFYRYQIVLRSVSTRAMTGMIRAVLGQFKLPKGIICSVDIDALNLM